MLGSAILMPGLGRRSDTSRRRKPALIGWTLVCVAFTAALSGISSLTLALGIFATAPVMALWGRQATFLPTAILFLILSLPCFLWVQETPSDSSSHVRGESAALPDAIRPFLFAAFWSLNAVSTVILFMSIYAKQAIGFSEEALHWFLVVSTSAAILGAFLWGWVTDRMGGVRTLGWVWAVWTLVFGLAAVSFNRTLFWILGCLAGVALGGTWVAARVLLVELVGPTRVGEAFGLFGLVSRLSAIGGPILWGLILWAARPWGVQRYRLGMLSLLGFMLVGRC